MVKITRMMVDTSSEPVRDHLSDLGSHLCQISRLKMQGWEYVQVSKDELTKNGARKSDGTDDVLGV